jgi:hypothetical protein
MEKSGNVRKHPELLSATKEFPGEMWWWTRDDSSIINGLGTWRACA